MQLQRRRLQRRRMNRAVVNEKPSTQVFSHVGARSCSNVSLIVFFYCYLCTGEQKSPQRDERQAEAATNLGIFGIRNCMHACNAYEITITLHDRRTLFITLHACCSGDGDTTVKELSPRIEKALAALRKHPQKDILKKCGIII